MGLKMKKLLVVRNDKLGDFVLSFPALAMLKQTLPDWQITALVPEYTAELAQFCPFIDDVIVDAGKRATATEQAKTLNQIKQAQFDASINFFSNTYNALLVWKAKIPYRLAPATKFAQIFYNHRLKQRRSLSEQAEFAYNLDLARFFLREYGYTPIEPSAPYLHFSDTEILAQKQLLAQQFHLPEHRTWVMVHAGSGGSANNLSLAQYADLVNGILQHTDACVILTAGPNEREQTEHLQQLIACDDGRVVVYDSTAGMVAFARVLACAHVFIAGSTGTLHLAGALNVATVGFYPSVRTASPVRWQTINAVNKQLAFSAPSDAPNDLTRIQITEILPTIFNFIESFQ